jgi:hypothetical protein
MAAAAAAVRVAVSAGARTAGRNPPNTTISNHGMGAVSRRLQPSSAFWGEGDRGCRAANGFRRSVWQGSGDGEAKGVERV